MAENSRYTATFFSNLEHNTLERRRVLVLDSAVGIFAYGVAS